MDCLEHIAVKNLHRTKSLHLQEGYQYEEKSRAYWGILLCAKGKLTLFHKEREIICDPFHLLVLPKSVGYHIYGNKSGLAALIEFESIDDVEKDEVYVFHITDPKQYMKDYEQIKTLSVSSKNRNQVMSILYCMFNRLNNESDEEENVLTPAIKYMEQHYMDISLNISVLAKEAHISVSHFHKLFRKCCNITPGEYLLNLRLQKAQIMLLNSNLSVTEIAESCGFTNLYHFSRVFKKNKGISPSQYRM